MEFIMSKLSFESPIKYTYDPVVFGDFVDVQLTEAKNMYRESRVSYVKLFADTSRCYDMSYMFYKCLGLSGVEGLNTSSCTNMSYMFWGCQSLKTLPILEAGNVMSINEFFRGEYEGSCALKNFGGFKDLGKCSSISGMSKNFLDRAYSLTHESLMNVINNLYDRKANGLSTLTIKFGTTHLAKLTDEEKAIAVNKGWTLS